MVAAKLWLGMDDGGKSMAGHGWLWVVVTKLWLVVDGCGWLWMVAQFSNAHLK